MQPVEKFADILCLRAEARSRCLNDLGIQAESLRDVDSRRSSRNSDAQLVSRLQGPLVEADSGVEYAFSVRRIDLQRSVVRGDHGHGSNPAEVVGYSYRERRALFGISGRPRFTDQHQPG